MNKYKLIILFVILALGYILIEKTAVQERNAYDDLQQQAIEKTISSFEKIKEEKIRLGIKIEDEDINQTGMIGSSEYGTEESRLATTLGSLSAKRTSTNPHFSALIVKYFKELGLKKGDIVAINSSASFPALMVSVISAVEVMELKSVVMVSIGASIYGATNNQFTLIDMYQVLLEHELISHPIDYWSFGGDMDIGRQFDETMKIQLEEKYHQIELIYEEDYQKNVNHRYNYYLEEGKPKVFINIGGNMVALGRNTQVFNKMNGLIEKKITRIDKNAGLIDYFLNNRIPCIHLLEINELATREGLIVDPIPLPTSNDGNIFYSKKYNIGYVVILLSVTFIYMLNLVLSKKNNLRRKYVKEKN